MQLGYIVEQIYSQKQLIFPPHAHITTSAWSDILWLNQVKSERIDLLRHPLVTSLLNDKWDQFGGYLYFINLVLFFLFVVFLTSFALTVLNPQTDVCEFLAHNCYLNSMFTVT